MTLLATFIVLVVFGPPPILVLALLTLLGIGLFAADGLRLARTTFWCPIKRRAVTAEFTVPAGSGQPEAVLSAARSRSPDASPAPGVVSTSRRSGGRRRSACSAGGPSPQTTPVGPRPAPAAAEATAA
jgi:hypothetical protein